MDIMFELFFWLAGTLIFLAAMFSLLKIAETNKKYKRAAKATARIINEPIPEYPQKSEYQNTTNISNEYFFTPFAITKHALYTNCIACTMKRQLLPPYFQNRKNIQKDD